MKEPITNKSALRRELRETLAAMTEQQRLQRAAEMLHAVGLGERLNYLPDQLSAGQG